MSLGAETVERCVRTAKSLRKIVDEFDSADLAHLVDEVIDVQVFSTMCVEHLFAQQRSGQDPHPHLLQYLQLASKFRKEYLKRVTICGFNPVFSAELYYNWMAIASVYIDELEPFMIYRSSEDEAKSDRLEPTASGALEHLLLTLKPQRTKAPRADTRKPTGVGLNLPLAQDADAIPVQIVSLMDVDEDEKEDGGAVPMRTRSRKRKEAVNV